MGPDRNGQTIDILRGLQAMAARRRLLRMHYEAGVGHIGGNLSALDAMLHLHTAEMGPDDVFVLSKGHAAGAMYIALWSVGLLGEDDLATFHRDGTQLAGHPIAGWHERIRFATGSLGHGLGLAAGVALGKRLRGEPGRVFCLLSDGECEEGAIWEAALFANHQKLANLAVLVDNNGLQGFGTTEAVASLGSLRDKFESFGLHAAEIDGHAADQLAAALRGEHDRPRAVVLRTIKGCGVSFMENAMDWHYLPLDAASYERAMAELEAPARPLRRTARERVHA